MTHRTFVRRVSKITKKITRFNINTVFSEYEDLFVQYVHGLEPERPCDVTEKCIDGKISKLVRNY